MYAGAHTFFRDGDRSGTGTTKSGGGHWYAPCRRAAGFCPAVTSPTPKPRRWPSRSPRRTPSRTSPGHGWSTSWRLHVAAALWSPAAGGPSRVDRIILTGGAIGKGLTDLPV